MSDEMKSLYKEPDFPADPPKELNYAHLLKDLSMQALEGGPRFNYRGLTAKQVHARQAEVRAILLRNLGLTPSRLPMKPTRVMERPAVQYDGYSIRPVVIERGAGWYITCHLYIPDGLTQPAPAVMHVHGHSYAGKRAIPYARRCRALARHGFVVLFVDYPEADERAGTGHALWYPTLANMPLQGIMVADNSAAFTYLAGLDFVDGHRIGVTGASGGGNQTAFFAAADPRVAAAAPCIAPTLFFYHAAIGGGAWCHCEAVPNLTAEGVEYHDLLALLAPKPLRVYNGILDPLFPIVGARITVREAAVAYATLGSRGGCTLEEHFCGHDMPLTARQSLYRFFSKALKKKGDVTGPRDEGDDIDLSDPRLNAFSKRPKNFRTIADLFREKVAAAKQKQLSVTPLNKLLGRTSADANARVATRYEDKRYLRLLLETGDGAMVPVVVRKGKTPRLPLALSNDGKAEALAHVTGAAASFDWRGQGETAPPSKEWQQRALHYLAIGGISLCGGRVTDLIATFRALRAEGFTVEKVIATGGEACLVALLAANLEPDLPKVELHGLLRSFKDAPGMEGQMRYTSYVPGMALATDISYLVKAVGRRVTVKQWLKPSGNMIREGFT